MAAFIRNALLFTIALIVVLELFFRFVIPASYAPYTESEPEHGFMYYGQQQVDGVFTSGRLAQVRVPWHINQDGWNAAIEYQPAIGREKYAIGVFGDSYIEGLYVDWDKSLFNILANELGSDAVVYPFAYSGNPLSEYQRLLEYAVPKFNLDAAVLLVDTGKLAASLSNYTNHEHCLQWRIEGDSIRATNPVPYQPRKMRIFRYSALMRYATSNANISFGLGKVNKASRKAGEQIPEAMQHHFHMVARHMLEKLAHDFPDVHFVLLFDAERRRIYAGDTESTTLLEKDFLAPVCQELGFGVVDLDPYFREDYRLHGKKFDFEFNIHWNEHGNAVVARALYDYFRPLSSSTGQME